MSLYMLDTDTCAFIMRGPSEKLSQRLRTVPIESQAISVVTFAELLYGVRVSHRSKQNQETLDAFLRHVSTLPWTEESAIHYADIRRHLHRAGLMIGANDLMIAAQARQAEAVLVTNNEREFRRVPALKIENWYA
jgi:tRNA(fMet)-specific endonuclease VapC